MANGVVVDNGLCSHAGRAPSGSTGLTVGLEKNQSMRWAVTAASNNASDVESDMMELLAQLECKICVALTFSKYVCQWHLDPFTVQVSTWTVFSTL